MRVGGFTLVEILITLALVGLLSSIVFSISWNRIEYMYVRMEKENAIDTINQALQNIMTIKWYNGRALQEGSIVFTSGSQEIKRVFVFSGTIQTQSLFTFQYLIPTRADESEKMEIVRIPYDLSCKLIAHKGDQKITRSGFLFRNKKNYTDTYCFVVDTFLCKVREIACKNGF